MDNGKVRICLKDGVPVVEIYHNGEIGRSDIIWIHQHIVKQHIQTPVDIIIDRVGRYSLSPEAHIAIAELMRDHDRVAFVLHHPSQEVICDLAATTYLAGHEVRKFYTLEDAHCWMTGHGKELNSALN